MIIQAFIRDKDEHIRNRDHLKIEQLFVSFVLILDISLRES